MIYPKVFPKKEACLYIDIGMKPSSPTTPTHLISFDNNWKLVATACGYIQLCNMKVPVDSSRPITVNRSNNLSLSTAHASKNCDISQQRTFHIFSISACFYAQFKTSFLINFRSMLRGSFLKYITHGEVFMPSLGQMFQFLILVWSVLAGFIYCIQSHPMHVVWFLTEILLY